MKLDWGDELSCEESDHDKVFYALPHDHAAGTGDGTKGGYALLERDLRVIDGKELH